jgi:hypothetical protein
MSLIIDGSNGLTFPNSTTQASAGQVLQVVQSTATSSTSTASGTLVTTGFSASITPKFSTSKIYVVFNGRCFNNGVNADAQLAIYRGATNIQSASSIYNSGGTIASLQTLSVLDSPATTSSTTYTMYFSVQNTGTTYLNVNGTADGIRSLTLMEIAA